MNSFYLAVALVAVSLSTTNAASHVVTSEDANGSQYLAFNGTISTSVTYPNTNGVVNCAGTASYGPYNSSYLYVGANPPWDPNPFFFELYHLSSEDAGLIGFTDDRVYNLDFSSSTYGCWDDDGTPCGLLAFDYHWVPEILLNLSLATIKQVKIGEENGYEISGDETSYIKNDTERASINTVDIYSWCYDLDVDFTSGFIWSVACANKLLG
ncbi:hypothetical protein EJ04DRAFT_47361 [Polyplosphaeria fusca]|uniref:Uncharacterized protein n=1 Tax=Polyplosphaeria fusca TaxID=682080 RepID=A0A9P4UYX6_9PLEO|nr:hypothetical protein EJ04DRAFT_47361 [Polyplosphaeria fusca]